MVRIVDYLVTILFLSFSSYLIYPRSNIPYPSLYNCPLADITRLINSYAVPPSREEYRTMFGGRSHPEKTVQEKGHADEHEHEHTMSDNFEDAPLVVFWRIILQQVIGWHWYLLSHITAGPNSGTYTYLSIPEQCILGF